MSNSNLVRLYRVDRDVEKREGVKHEGRLTDQDDTREEEDPGNDLDYVEFVPQHDGREEDGDYGAGEDDAERVWDVHEGDAGEATDETY